MDISLFREPLTHEEKFQLLIVSMHFWAQCVRTDLCNSLCSDSRGQLVSGDWRLLTLSPTSDSRADWPVSVGVHYTHTESLEMQTNKPGLLLAATIADYQRNTSGLFYRQDRKRVKKSLDISLSQLF